MEAMVEMTSREGMGGTPGFFPREMECPFLSSGSKKVRWGLKPSAQAARNLQLENGFRWERNATDRKWEQK